MSKNKKRLKLEKYYSAEFYNGGKYSKATMSELQAALEFQVELSKFYNVDLFQRGYYQVRCCMKTAPKAPVKVEVSLPKNSECSLVFPASLINGVAVSKTFHILYRNEDIIVNDIIVFKVYMLVDAQRILQSIEDADFQLSVDLWFTDEEVGPDQMEKFQCIVSRTLKLHFSPTKGLHHHVPVLFDYFHLAVMSVSVHGMLLALQQPYINLTRQQPKPAWAGKNHSTMESVIFGNNGTPSMNNRYALSPRLQQACYVHTHICSILLVAYDSLQQLMEDLMEILPQKHKVMLDHIDCNKKLEELRNIAQSHDNEEELFQMIQTSIAQVCAQNVILWSQFIDLVTLNNKVTQRLAAEHHKQRIQRFAEAFFYHHSSKKEMLACYEPSVHGHSDLATLIRSSTYFHSIPPLSVECSEIDGDDTSLPIVFEDVYCEQPKLRKFEIGSEENVDNQSSSHVSRSDSSHSGGSSSSPRSRRHSRKKIPKNLKLDSLRRPSSMYAQEISNQVAYEVNPCTLVGYRKLDTSSAPVYSMPQTSMELGTLSPVNTPICSLIDSGDNQSFFCNAVSMPTLLARGHINMSNSGSMPELSVVDAPSKEKSRVRQSLSADLQAQQRLDSLIAGDLGNPVIRTKCQDLTDTDRLSEKYSMKQVSHRDSVISENRLVVSDVELDSTEHSPAVSDVVSTQHSCLSHNVLCRQDSSESDEGVGPIENGYIASSPSSTLDISPQDGAILLDKLSNSNDDTDSEHLKSTVSAKSDQDSSLSNQDISKVLSTPQSSIQSDLSGSDIRSTSDSGYVESTLDDKSKTSKDLNKELLSECTAMELLKEEFEKCQLEDESSLAALAVVGSTHSLDATQLSTHKTRPDSYVSAGRPSTSSVAAQINRSPVVRKFDLKHQGHGPLGVSASLPELSSLEEDKSKKLVAAMPDKTINFKLAKETLRKLLKYPGQLYSDQSTHASTFPYFLPRDLPRGYMNEGIHLIICVHGLDGNSADLRLVRTYLEMALPGEKIDFLMSEKNQMDTFADFDLMTDKLVQEIFYHLETYGLDPARISFVGHSLGNLIIRSALAHPQMALLLPKLHTLLSLSGPHLGTLYNTSGLVNMGMWFMQKWKKSGSLLQLSLKDHSDPRETFLYKLSQKTGLEFFRNILLVGSQQDRYVPYHSSRIELCKSATRDSTGTGGVYAEMVSNILQPIVYKSDINFIRYDVFHALPSNANTMIGRAAHIAVLDSELFIEKLLTVSVLKYFK